MEDQQNMATTLKQIAEKVESLEADLALLKTLVKPPVGFASWEQFDRVTQDAYENQ